MLEGDVRANDTAFCHFHIREAHLAYVLVTYLYKFIVKMSVLLAHGEASYQCATSYPNELSLVCNCF